MDGRPRATAGWSLSLVIPAFNEEASIGRAIAEADDALAALAADYEILIVDDGSRDATAQVVAEAAQARPRVRLLRHAENRGYGAALRTGFEAARFDRVAFTDADCQFDLHDLAALVPLTDRYPLAVGYRVRRQDPWRRRFFSRGYNLLVRGLLGTRVRDCDCAFKVFRTDALASLLPETDGFFVNAEMLTRARQRGYPLAEVGVRHRPRLHGRSTVSLGDIPRTLATLLPFWWSRVLFPGPGAGRKVPADRNLARWGFALVLVAAALLFFSRLNGPLLEPDEARYAEIPRQMLVQGQITVPVLHGQPYYQKPPLLYWLVMGSYALFGVHDWAARLVPCSAGFLTVLVAYFWGRRTLGPRAALGGALVLCLSGRFVYLGRMLTMDSLLALWVVLAWAAAQLAVGRGTLRWRWWLVSAAACGLGLMTKGPVALALAAVPLVALRLLDGRTARLGIRAWLAYLAVAAGLAAPWYGIVTAHDARFLTDCLWTHHVRCFAQPLDHEGPLWYYLPGLLLGMLPWTLFLLPLLRFLGRRSASAGLRRPAGLGFALLTSLWCLAFYSAAGSKRPGYILPAMAPLALALGCYLDAAMPRKLFRQMRSRAAWALSRLAFRGTLLCLAAGLGISLLAVHANLVKPVPALLLGSATLTGLAWRWRRGPDPRLGVSLGWCAGTTLVLLVAGLHLVLPGYERKFSLRAQVRPHHASPAGRDVPVVCYPHRWDSVSFYLRRDDVRVYPAAMHRRLIADLRSRPRTLVFIQSDSPFGQPLQDLVRALPASLEFIPQGHQGIVTRGFIQRREEVPVNVYARR